MTQLDVLLVRLSYFALAQPWYLMQCWHNSAHIPRSSKTAQLDSHLGRAPTIRDIVANVYCQQNFYKIQSITEFLPCKAHDSSVSLADIPVCKTSGPQHLGNGAGYPLPQPDIAAREQDLSQ